MLYNFAAAVALVGVLYSGTASAHPQQCAKDACLQRVIAEKNRHGRGECDMFFKTVLVPQAYTSIASTITNVNFQFTYPYATKTVTQHLTSTDQPVIEAVSTITKTVTFAFGDIRPSPKPTITHQPEEQLEVSATSPPSTSTRFSTELPLNIFRFCTDVSKYSSACSCVGATKRITTAPTHTNTNTHYKTKSVTRTVTERDKTFTATDITTVTVSPTTISESVHYNTITTSVAPAQCTEIGFPGYYYSGSAFYIDGPSYSLYYAGKGYTENPDNPGNSNSGPGGFPSQDTVFRNLGPNDTCDAIQECAYFTQRVDGVFYASFDVHYYSFFGYWRCVAYVSPNTNASYFNVPNHQISQAYGFSGSNNQ